MSAPEDLLRRSLHAQAGRTTYQPTSALEVARRARALQRSRTRRTVLVAAAAAAIVAVPAGLLLGSDGSERPPAPAGPTVTIGSLSELPTGAPPGVDYLLGRTYVFADGDRVELDVEPGSVQDAAPYPDGVIVTRRSTGDPSGIADHLWFARSGELEYGGCGGDELALSSDGELFAYARTLRGCDTWGRWPVLQWGDTDTMLGDPVHVGTLNGQRVEPVGVTKDRILYNATETTGSTLPPRVYTIDEVGVPVMVDGIVRAAAWDPTTERVAGCPSEGRCVVVGEADGEVQLTLDAGEEPLSFSPDGRYLATAEGEGEEGRLTTLTVRDSRTGTVVVALTGDEVVVAGQDSVAWEGPAHLLIAHRGADGQGLVRLGVDGSAELATAVGEATVGGYLLPGP